ncbi:DUF317 domain-containing protein [Kitasatospora phosalacinea]|uniref:DUF317 domain-containing protein n=1 Tax=Kitasatospora phosalacinea TaxID=2065 RepID=UPI0035D8CE9F
MNVSAPNLPVPIAPGPEDRSWLSTDHCAGPVFALLVGLGWPVVDTPEANVHCSSPDGRLYVGWLPEDPDAWARGILWRIQVRPADAEPWSQEFGTHTPSEAVAGFFAALIAASTR